MERRREKENLQAGFPVMAFGKCLLFSYILTGVLLLVMALLLYKLELSAGMVSLGVILIYVVSTFLGGFVMGKRIGNKKFFWGFLIGLAYFLILLIVSLLANHSAGEVTNDIFTTLLICAGAGMMGGMLG